VGAVYDWRYRYDPFGGPNGYGALTVTVVNVATGEVSQGVRELTPEQREVGATFDSFGMTSRALSDQDVFSTTFIDNLTYTVPSAAAETFDSVESAEANGWTELLSRDDGQDFGFSPTDNAGGTAGEAGGTFKRNATRHMYVDVFPGTLTLDDSISASGRITMTTDPTGNAGTVIGHSNSEFAGGEDEANVIGLVTIVGPQFGAHIVLADNVRNEGSFLDVDVGAVYDWSYSDDPFGGTDGQGALTVTVVDVATGEVFEGVRELTPEQRSVGATFDSFGMTSRALSDQDVHSTTFIDDVNYTVPLAPGSAELSIAGIQIVGGNIQLLLQTSDTSGTHVMEIATNLGSPDWKEAANVSFEMINGELTAEMPIPMESPTFFRVKRSE
jgi:hypothetical protein